MLDEVDINAMDYPALSALKDRIEEKVREMREVGVCASMWELRSLVPLRWIRTSNLRVLSAAPLPDGVQGQLRDGDGRAR